MRTKEVIIAIDFDGTVAEHKYPTIGRKLPFAIETLRKLQSDRHRLIPWTAHKGGLLEEALSFCREHGLGFCAVNRNYPEEERDRNNRFPRGLKADAFIDDRNLGGLPDWSTIYEMMAKGLSYEDSTHKYKSEYEPEKPKDFLSRFFR